MRRCGFITAVVLALLCAAGAVHAAVTPAQFNEAVKALEANAELWAKDEPIGSAAQAALSKIRFDKNSVPLLQTFLRSAKRDPAGLYVVNKLLDRLLLSDSATITAAVTDVKNFQSRLRNAYRPFPKMSRTQQAALKMPAYSPRLTTDAIMARMAVIDRQRDIKVARDLPVAKYNQMVGKLTENTYRLICLAGDPREDAVLVRTMLLEERAGRAGFLQIANALAAAAPKMDPDRAKKLYAALRTHASRLAMQKKKKYEDYGKVNLRRDDTSTFETKDDYAGIRLITTLNKIAEAAKDPSCPKLKVPNSKQIDEQGKRK